MNELNNLGKGFSLFTFAGCLLIILKAAEVIKWGWLWVLIPFWGPVALAFVALVMMVIVMAISKLIGWVVKKL